MKLSDTQSLILSKASQHEQGLAAAPQGLPAAARNAVFRSMLKNGLLAECAAPREYAGLAWREDADGARIALRITDAGLRAIGVEPDEGAAPDTATVADTAPTAAPDAQPRTGGRPARGSRPGRACGAGRGRPRRGPRPPGPARPRPCRRAARTSAQAAQAVLDAWDDDADRGALAGPMERLRAALAKPARAARDPDAPRKPREGTKQEKVLAMLRRPGGRHRRADRRGHRLGGAHGARLLRRAQEEGHRGRGAGARPPGRAEQGGRQGQLQHLPHRGPRRGRGAGAAADAAGMPVGAAGGPRLAVGLYRVSTAEQGQSGLGLEAQRAAVRAFVAAQGWTLVAEFADVASGKDDRRPGFQAALARCRQLGAVLVAARLDRITRRAHTLSQLLEDGFSIRAADMPGADDLMMRIYAAMAQKERELIGERTRAALAAAKARGHGAGRRPGLPARQPARTRPRRPWRARQAAERAAHRLALEVERLRGEGVSTLQGLARALTGRGVPTPSGTGAWTHTTVARVLARAAA